MDIRIVLFSWGMNSRPKLLSTRLIIKGLSWIEWKAQTIFNTGNRPIRKKGWILNEYVKVNLVGIFFIFLLAKNELFVFFFIVEIKFFVLFVKWKCFKENCHLFYSIKIFARRVQSKRDIFIPLSIWIMFTRPFYFV